MGHCFSHLTKADRYKIEALLNNGHSAKEIAAEIHVHISTIYREVKRARMVHRNSDWTEEERYNPDEAHRRYRENLSAKGAPLKIGRDYALAEYLERKVLEEGRSPAAALADITLEGLEFKTTICTSTFYGYITKGVFLMLTNNDLPEKAKRKRKYRKVKTAKRAPRGKSIEKRPAEVEGREVFGHWEMDTVVGKKRTKARLLVLSERVTRREIIIRIKDGRAETVVAALDRLERLYGAAFYRIFKTITVDNGSEFADADGIERSARRKDAKRTTVYYCHAYSSCERGTNENINRMIRRQFPKGTDFEKVTAAEVKRVETWLNNYPREILGFMSSAQAFELAFNRAA